MTDFYSPMAINRFASQAVLHTIKARGDYVDDYGRPEWHIIEMLAWDAYSELSKSLAVTRGFIEIDKPIRENDTYVVAAHHTVLLQYHALPAAKAGLDWNIKEKRADLDQTIKAVRDNFHRVAIERDYFNNIIDNMNEWRKFFPDRVADIDLLETDTIMERLSRSEEYTSGSRYSYLIKTLDHISPF